MTDMNAPAPREDGYSAGVRAAADALTEQIAYYKGMAESGGSGHGISERQASAVECAQRSILALLDAPALPDARAGAVEPVAWTTATQFDGRTSNSLDPVEVTWNVEELRIAAHQLHRGVTFSAFARRQFAEAVLGYIAVSAPPPTPACTATDGPASACVYRAPGLGTAADWERG